MTRLSIPTLSLDQLRDEIARLDIKRNTLMDDAFDAIESGALARASTIQHELVQLENAIADLNRRKHAAENRRKVKPA